MGCDGLWSYLTNFVMRLKLEREKPSSPMYLPLSKFESIHWASNGATGEQCSVWPASAGVLGPCYSLSLRG